MKAETIRRGAGIYIAVKNVEHMARAVEAVRQRRLNDTTFEVKK